MNYESNKNLIERLFFSVPELPKIAMTCKNISDYNGAHLSMLPVIIRDAASKEGSREFHNAKSSFMSALAEVTKYIEKNPESVDMHISLAGEQLIFCYYHNPKICHDVQMKVFIEEMIKNNLIV